MKIIKQLTENCQPDNETQEILDRIEQIANEREQRELNQFNLKFNA